MNKEKLKSLTWKYFWEQKIIEIVDHFENSWSGYCMCMIMFGLGFQVGWIRDETGIQTFKWLAIIGLCFLGIWILIGIIVLIKNIIEWLKNNWKNAAERARRELE